MNGFKFTLLPLIILFTPLLAFAQQWQGEYTYGPFEIYVNVDINKVSPTLEQIAALDGELTARFQLPEIKEKIKLYIFPDVEAYNAFIQKKYRDAPQRRALFAMEKGKPGKIFTFLHPDFADDLRHECVHALLHARIGRLPIWIDEGLAEFFEVPPAERNTKDPYFGQIKRNVSLNLFSPVPDLKKLEAITDMNRFQEKNYRDAWAWMNFLLNDPQRQKIVADYLTACKNHPETEKEKNAFPSFFEGITSALPDYKSGYKAYWKGIKKEK